MRIAEARRVMRSWQARLRLLDWKITTRWARAGELHEPGIGPMDACNQWYTETSEAHITLDRKADDIEHAIVHELLHLVIDAPRGAYQKYDIITERAINTIADALLEKERYGGG